jgi:hypothetical protein
VSSNWHPMRYRLLLVAVAVALAGCGDSAAPNARLTVAMDLSTGQIAVGDAVVAHVTVTNVSLDTLIVPPGACGASIRVKDIAGNDVAFYQREACADDPTATGAAYPSELLPPGHASHFDLTSDGDAAPGLYKVYVGVFPLNGTTVNSNTSDLILVSR